MKLAHVSRGAIAPALLAAASLLSCTHHGVALRIDGLDLREEASRTDRVALDLRAGETLDVETTFGSIDVEATTSGDPEAVAELSVRAPSAEQAQEALARQTLAAERTSTGVRVRIVGEPLQVDSGGSRVVLAPRVALRVLVPPGCSLQAVTSSGSIDARGPFASARVESGFGSVEIARVDGDVRAGSRSGSVTLEAVNAGRVEATSQFGAIAVTAIRAEDLIVDTKSGSVDATDVEAASAKLRSNFGSIEVTRFRGDLEAKTSSGKIRLLDASGGRADLHSGFGSISVDRSRSALRADTSSGSIEVAGSEGALDLESRFGSVRVEGVVTALRAKTSSGKVNVVCREGSTAISDWSLESGFGSVELALPEGFACTVDASTSFGTASSDIAVGTPLAEAEEGSARDRSKALRGALHGGGPTVKLRSASGSVRIRASRP